MLMLTRLTESLHALHWPPNSPPNGPPDVPWSWIMSSSGSATVLHLDLPLGSRQHASIAWTALTIEASGPILVQ